MNFEDNKNLVLPVSLERNYFKAAIGNLVEEILREKGVLKSEDEILLSSEDVCNLFHVKPVTLYRWANSGYLIPAKVGRKNLYKKNDVELLITKRDETEN
jgi:lipopolysaccharide export LptBFGC system permease protein LptF